MTRIAQTLERALAERQTTLDFWGIAEARLMADPRSPAGFEAMVDQRVYPGTRVLLFEAITRGVCQNPREVLFGVTSDRFRNIDRAAAAMRDIPVIDDLAAIQRRRLTRVAAMTRGERLEGCLGKEF